MPTATRTSSPAGPKILIGDEPVSALDVSIQAQVVNILEDLKEDFGLTLVVIAHDLAVIRHMADRVAVMYLGEIVELAPARDLFDTPLHPYTERLLQSIPRLEKKSRARLDVIKGNVPVPLDPPRECGFYSRCLQRMEGRCNTAIPALVDMEEGHAVRCFLHSDERER